MVVDVGVTFFKVLPSTEPTLLLILKLVGAPPESFHDKLADLPLVIVVASAVSESIFGAGGFTVIVTVFVDLPEMFDAVKVYVVFFVGATVVDVKPKTEPTPLSTESNVAIPPDNLHDRVTDWPCVIVVLSAVSESIFGAGGLTVTVTLFVAVPVIFVAVKI